MMSDISAAKEYSFPCIRRAYVYLVLGLFTSCLFFCALRFPRSLGARFTLAGGTSFFRVDTSGRDNSVCLRMFFDSGSNFCLGLSCLGGHV